MHKSKHWCLFSSHTECFCSYVSIHIILTQTIIYEWVNRSTLHEVGHEWLGSWSTLNDWVHDQPWMIGLMMSLLRTALLSMVGLNPVLYDLHSWFFFFFFHHILDWFWFLFNYMYFCTRAALWKLDNWSWQENLSNHILSFIPRQVVPS